MKTYIALLLATCLAGTSGVYAAVNAPLPEPLEWFGEGATLMMTGINARNATDLWNAAEKLGHFPYNSIEEVEFNEKEPGDLTAAAIQFNDTYCSLLLMNDFEIVELDPLDVTRDPDPTLLFLTRGIRGGGELSITLYGSEEMAIGIAASAPSVLQYILESKGRNIPVETGEEGYFSQAVWEMGTEVEPFILTITNPGEATVSFTLALEGATEY